MKKSIEKKSTRWGLVVSGAWLLGAFIFASLSWDDFKTLTPNEWGDFAAGLAAPLAFLWLVLGYFLQREELELQRKEITALTKENERQAKAIEATESHTRRDVYLRLLNLLETHQVTLAVEMLLELEHPDEKDLRNKVGAGRYDEVFNILGHWLNASGIEPKNVVANSWRKEGSKIAWDFYSGHAGLESFYVSATRKTSTKYLSDILVKTYLKRISFLEAEARLSDASGAMAEFLTLSPIGTAGALLKQLYEKCTVRESMNKLT